MKGTTIENTRIDLSISETHPDLLVLCKHTNSENNEMRGASRPGVEFNYIRVQHLRHWRDEDINTLKRQFEEANKETSEYTFVFHGIDDFEYDDDRTWDASFSFDSIKK